MVEGIEAIGEAVTGGMAARAVEPHAGEAGGAHDGKCLNCGSALIGEFCHQCGQHGHVHRTVGAFWHDIAHSVFHFDGKMWRTLPLLAWHPGELTRRYVEGERAKFVSPMALFLFSVFLMFAVISAFGGPFTLDSPTGTAEDRAKAEQEFRRERDKSLKEIAELREQRARLAAAGQETRDIDIDIRNAQNELALEERLFRQALGLIEAEAKRDAAEAKREEEQKADPKPSTTPNEAAGKSDPKPAGTNPPAAPKEGGLADEITKESTSFRTNIPGVDKALEKASANPSLLLYKLQSNAYKFSWALIPISVPFLWLMFLHRRRYWKYKAYDHIVFITYSIAFMSLGFVVLTLLRPLGVTEAVAGIAIAFGPPIHMYRQLRGAYRLSRFSALWRTFLLINFAFIAAGLFFTLLLALGAFG